MLAKAFISSFFQGDHHLKQAEETEVLLSDLE